MNSAVCMLEAAASKFGSKTAIVDEFGEISFIDLRNKARAVGAFLADSDISSAPVIVYMKKSLKCIISFMGVLYSGRAYVPVASDMPSSRVQKIIDNLNPSCIIADDECAEILKNSGQELPPVFSFDSAAMFNGNTLVVDEIVSRVIDTDPIYIMYTSGSTGTPKGVTVCHRGVIDYANWLREEFKFNENDIFGNQAPFYFDNSILDIYSCLLCGSTMVIIPEVFFNFQSKLPEYIEEKNITVIFWVPTVLINVANSGALEQFKMPSLKKVMFCGEVMPNTQLNIWRKNHPDAMYANLYGPTEITDVCTFYVVDREFKDSEPLPIGKACRNMRVYIIKEDGTYAATGEQGELCVSGSGLALGYWNNPEITNRVFVSNPLNTVFSERIYRTGDLAYINEEGLIMYIGRMDSQIKINGNRVELGEIENAAMCLDDVTGACAQLDKENNRIVLFLESSNERKLREINMKLRALIPKYMLPGKIVFMEKFPHTPNDKIDRVTLRKMMEGGEV